MDKLKVKIEDQITETFSFNKGTFDVSTEVDLRTVSSIDDIKETDHVFNIVDQKSFDEKILAIGDIGGLQIKIGTTLVNKILSGENSRTIPHELGHTAGLHHSKGKDNIMSMSLREDQNTRKNISVSQFNEIRDNYKSGRINNKTAIGTKFHVGIKKLYNTLPYMYIYTSKYLRQ